MTNQPAEVPDGYLDVIAAAAATGRGPQRADLDTCRRHGGQAADHAISLRTLTDSYLARRRNRTADPARPGRRTHRQRRPHRHRRLARHPKNDRRSHPGPAGIQQFYEEARDTQELADRLGLTAPVLHAAELLVFPVLLRDRAAITDLVHTVLAPLTHARGGAEPILTTLNAFFACHGNTTATARRLHVSTRTVTYRLNRVRHLTGYDPDDPTQRFTLQAAVLGARLLNGPDPPKPRTDCRPH